MADPTWASPGMTIPGGAFSRRSFSGRAVRHALAGASLLALLGACADAGTASGAATGAVAVNVTSSADTCSLSSSEVPAGPVVFHVANTGSDVTELYLLTADGTTTVAELENIGPGITRDLVITAKPGSYVAACKPGMTGDGIRSTFTVTGTSPTAASDASTLAGKAVAEYVAYVRDESAQLLTATTAFATAYTAGDDARARELYPAARTHWERIEPVAEAFGDLDPRIDLRKADVEAGTEWTGWHRLEKDLWPPAAAANAGTAYVPLPAADRARLAGLLVNDTTELTTRTHAGDFTLGVDQIGNGAKSLLDEVATSKVTGEEEIWSHTDLWDFQANVDGAKVAYTTLREATQDSDLTSTLDARFAELQTLLDAQRGPTGFVPYTDLSPEQVRTFAHAVDALGEPLARLTAAVVLQPR